jgi:RNA polymerase sigma-70 factor (ECF subfamily)
MAGAPADGLVLLDDPELSEALTDYHLYHAARADLLRRDHRYEEAAKAYQRALELVSNETESRYLQRRLDEVRHQSARL